MSGSKVSEQDDSAVPDCVNPDILDLSTAAHHDISTQTGQRMNERMDGRTDGRSDFLGKRVAVCKVFTARNQIPALLYSEHWQ